MKKIISVILSFAILFSMSVISASANSETMIEFKIIKALNSIECIKDNLGLSSIDFAELEYTDPIFAYDYMENGFKLNSEFIPLLYNDSLIGWIIKRNDGNESIYQFSNAFVKQVNSHISNNVNFAIIYDRNSSYLFDGSNLYKLEDITLLVESRKIIRDISDINNSNLGLNNFASRYVLNYTSPNSTARTPAYYKCAVSFVSQNPPSNMCWAASIASITNFLKNTNYTAVSVAKNWYNTNVYAEYNKGLTLGLQDDVLKTYGISYTYKNKVPSDGVIFNNIYKGFPISATFKWSNGYHDVVIYGINSIAGYLYIMDPETGFSETTYTASVGHRYISSRSGVTLTLNRATCKYWTS